MLNGDQAAVVQLLNALDCAESGLNTPRVGVLTPLQGDRVTVMSLLDFSSTPS